MEIRFTPLLRTDGDSVGDGASQDLGHGVSVFGGVEFQPGTLGILFQQSLAFEAAPHAEESMFQAAALEVGIELLADMVWQ